jgi:hypothetical protein
VTTNIVARYIRPALAALAILAGCRGESSTPAAPSSLVLSPAILGVQVSPLIIDPAHPEMVHFQAFVAGTPARVDFALQDQFVRMSMTAGEQLIVPTAGGSRQAVVWSADVPSDQLLLQPRRVGMMAQIGGPVAVAVNGAESPFSLRLWVKDASVTPVTVSQLAPDVQASARVVNVRDDALATAFQGSQANSPVPRFAAWAPAIRRFYNFFSDDYDYIAIIPSVKLPDGAAGEHLGYRNTTQGIGQAPFDLSVTDVGLGSASRLQSVLYFSEPTLADFAASTFSHEMAHRWMVRLNTREFANSAPHWPISDLAEGLMGYGLTGVSGRFPFQIDQTAPNSYRYRKSTQAQTFNSMELYLMGLLPAAAVTDTFRVFTGATPNPVDGLEFGAIARAFTIDSLLVMVGPRKPDALASPKQFRVATIVITRGRLLSATEMAMFDLLAARGEALGPMPPITESADGAAPTVLPFYEATGHRATVVTTLRP